VINFSVLRVLAKRTLKSISFFALIAKRNTLVGVVARKVTQSENPFANNTK